MITIARDGGDVRPVLPKSDRGRGAPEWSPAGDQIVYHRPDLGSLHRVRPDGSEAMAIAPSGTIAAAPAISPDGRRIAVAVRDESRPEYAGFGIAVAILEADGTEILRVPITPFGAPKPTWSPDGTRIAYCEGIEEAGVIRSVVRVMAVSTGTVHTVTPTSASDCNPIWRP